MSFVGGRSAGSASSREPARMTVTRRDDNVSRASGVTWPPADNSTVAPMSSVRASASVMMSKTLMSRWDRIHQFTNAPMHQFTNALIFSCLEHCNVRKIPILLGVIEAIADDE